MITGNSIKLGKPENEKATLFKIDNVRSFIDCVSTIAHHVRERKRKHVKSWVSISRHVKSQLIDKLNKEERENGTRFLRTI